MYQREREAVLMPTAPELIQLLNLQPLPQEGGYYRETYRSAERLAASALPPRYGQDKALGTAMYYFLTPDTFSALHRLPTDEVFHFYLGNPVEMLQLYEDGRGRVVTLGPDLLAGQSPQLVVPRGVWQGSCLAAGGAFALLGTTAAPGFDFADYEAGDRAGLSARYPEFADLISLLTRAD
jgi:predicted cupin superfamily sugar epimerase